MNYYYLRLFVFTCAFLVFGSVCACPGNLIPIHLLGKNAYEKEVDFRQFLAVVDVAPSPDSELLEANGAWESWFIVDKNRNYFRLSAWDGVIKGIVAHDRCLITEKGIRIGDTFSSVRAVYPGAKFKRGEKLVEHGVFDLLANDGKVEFLFSAKIVLDLIKDGYQVDLNDEIVKQSRVSAIIIHH